MKIKKIIVILLCINLFIASGCWDKVELNERAFISGILIDINENYKGDADENKNNPFDEEKPKKLKVTFGVINPSKLQGGENSYIPETVDAVNVPDAMDKLGEIISRKPFYGQVRVIVFTTDVLKDEKIFKEALDEFERKAVIDRTMNLVVFKGNKKDFVQNDPKLEPFIAAYLGGILKNAGVSSNIFNPNLNDILVASRNGDGTFVVPVLSVKNKENDDLSVNELALIKDYKLLGFLSPKYVKMYKLINGKMENGRQIVNYKGISVPYYIFIANRKMWLESEGENLKYKIKITTEGDIEQFERGRVVFNPKTINEVKMAIEDSMKKEVEETIKYFQDDLGVDYLGIGDYTNKYHHKVYEKNKDNWNEVFKKAKFEVEVEVDIRRVGVVKE